MINPQPATDLLRLEEQRYRSLVEATTAIVWTGKDVPLKVKHRPA